MVISVPRRPARSSCCRRQALRLDGARAAGRARRRDRRSRQQRQHAEGERSGRGGRNHGDHRAADGQSGARSSSSAPTFAAGARRARPNARTAPGIADASAPPESGVALMCAIVNAPSRFVGRGFRRGLARLTAVNTAEHEAIDPRRDDHRRRGPRGEPPCSSTPPVRPLQRALRRGARAWIRRGFRSAAFDALAAEQRDALVAGGGACADLSSAPARQIMVVYRGRRHRAWPAGHAAGPRRHLCARAARRRTRRPCS